MLELKVGMGDQAMGWMEFVSSLVGSLAWPIAAFLIAVLFRTQIAGLLNKIRRLTWGDKVFDFAEKLDKIEDASREIAAEEPHQVAQLAAPNERFQKLLEISPSAAILDAWGPVEAMLRQMGAERNYDPRTLQSPFQTMRLLRDDGIISTKIFQLLRDLQALRNAAAHQREVYPTDALRFQDLSEQLIRALRKG